MAELINAMKGVIQSSTARTSSTYASTDLIQLYDSNNEPTIKISKDDLMAAVKASLPSLLSDQGTSGTAFPSIASGVLGSMTAANLASVLGVAGLPAIKFEVTASDPVSNVFDLGGSQSGIFIFGLGGGGDFRPGVYSISRNGDITTICECVDISSITATGYSITVVKSAKIRATGLWIKIQT